MKAAFGVLLIALILTVAATVYPYGATTVTLRVKLPLLKLNTATASCGNFGLTNGSFATYVSVDEPDSESGSFGNQRILSFLIDRGPYENAGTASAYVNGYDDDDVFQMDDDSDSN